MSQCAHIGFLVSGFPTQAELVARDNAHASRFRAAQHETDSGAQVLSLAVLPFTVRPPPPVVCRLC
jgi:hypothetical protein